jgi:hypothetical protein
MLARPRVTALGGDRRHRLAVRSETYGNEPYWERDAIKANGSQAPSAGKASAKEKTAKVTTDAKAARVPANIKWTFVQGKVSRCNGRPDRLSAQWIML